MNVFVDTNVLLDVLARREPFYADSAAIWTLAERGKTGLNLQRSRRTKIAQRFIAGERRALQDRQSR